MGTRRHWQTALLVIPSAWASLVLPPAAAFAFCNAVYESIVTACKTRLHKLTRGEIINACKSTVFCGYNQIMTDTVADRVKAIREKAGLTQEQFARELSTRDRVISRGGVANWETGGGIRRFNLNRIATRFGVSLQWLAGSDAGATSITPAVADFGGMVGVEGELVELSSLPDDVAGPIKAAMTGRRAEIWRLSTELLEGASLKPGDLLLVDLDRKPREGNIVLAMVTVNGKLTLPIFRLLYPPLLMPVTTTPTGRAPEKVDNQTVIVRGVVFSSHRSL
jgi:transcriptional regulator with XRE-family HTH domain